MTRVLLSLSVCLSLTASLIGQDKTDPPPATNGGDKAAQPAGGAKKNTQQPPTRIPREQRARAALRSPEERQNERLDRMMDRATEMYQLDDSQKITARNEIKTMQDQRRAAMGPEADEYDQLQKKQAEIFSKAGPDEPTTQSSRETIRTLRTNPELRQIRKRMQEIDQKYPFNWDEAIKRIEATLPPEQAAKGHALWEQRRGGDRNSADRFPRFPREEADRENRRREREQRMAERNGKTPAPTESGPTPQNVKVRELHPWEIYVKKFISDHQLTDAQSNSAMAILKDMRQRAEQVDKHLRSQPHATTQSVDAEFKKQSDAIFDEMKQRLDGLLTAAQRAQTSKP